MKTNDDVKMSEPQPILSKAQSMPVKPIDIFNRAEDENFHHLESAVMLSTGKGDY